MVSITKVRLMLARPAERAGRFMLFTEDGKQLPNQLCVDIDNQAGTVTVTFLLDGDNIKIKGDV